MGVKEGCRLHTPIFEGASKATMGAVGAARRGRGRGCGATQVHGARAQGALILGLTRELVQLLPVV